MKKTKRITAKIIFVFLLVSCFVQITTAQNSGIYFDQQLTWTAIRAKAMKENKFIFVNCYSTHCKSCFSMSDNIFSTEEAGDAFNPNYICVNMRMEMTEKDPGTIKTVCGDARFMMSEYKINTFPTFLFFAPDGKLMHEAVGPSSVAQLINDSREALETARQYYYMVNQYHHGCRDTLLLESLSTAAFQVGDGKLSDSVLDDLLPRIKNTFTKNRLDLIGRTVQKPNGPGFELFLLDAAKIDSLEKPDFAEEIVVNAIVRHNPMIMDLFNDHSPKQSWDKIYNDLEMKYGSGYAHRITARIKVCYYKSQTDWDLYSKNLIIYLKEYGEYLHPDEMNNYAWDIFKYCTNPDDLAFGLSCSIRSLATDEKLNPEFIDTYANLLYKSGKIASAIAKENEAIGLAVAFQKKEYKNNLVRMKAGQPTWTNFESGLTVCKSN